MSVHMVVPFVLYFISWGLAGHR